MILGAPALDRIGYALEVLAHPLDSELLVAELEGLENAQMLLVVALTRSEDAEDEPLLLGKEVVQHVEKLREDGVLARARDLAVERHVHFVQYVVVAQVLASGGQRAAQLDQILERRVLDRFRHAVHLERNARVDEIEQQLLGDGSG